MKTCFKLLEMRKINKPSNFMNIMKNFSIVTFAFLGIFSLQANTCPPCAAKEFVISNCTNPSSEVITRCGGDFSLAADFLYWVPQELGLVYAITGKGPGAVDVVGSYDFKGKIAKIDPDWEPGFRISMGYKVPQDHWKLSFAWTWFKANPKNALSDNLFSPFGYAQYLTNGGAKIPALDSPTRVEAEWDLTYNVFDLILSRASFVSKHMALTPFLGLKGALLHHEITINNYYPEISNIQATLSPKSDFNGGGLQAGLDSKFLLNCEWSFYGLFSGALVYGRFDCRDEVSYDSVRWADVKDSYNDSLASTTLALGFQWERYLANDRAYLQFRLGWEQNVWFSLNHSSRFNHRFSEGKFTKEKGDLTLQGITFNGRLDF